MDVLINLLEIILICLKKNNVVLSVPQLVLVNSDVVCNARVEGDIH